MRERSLWTDRLGWWPFVVLPLVWLGALVGGGADMPFDREIMFALLLDETSRLAAVWVFITELGGWRVLIPVAVAGAVYLLVRRRRRDAVLLLGIVLSARLLVELQKLLVGRARPDEMHLVEVFSQSFPSGHAGNSLVTYLTLAILLSGNRGVVVAALALTGLIGLSRVVLGVHWPSDVIGGWAFALFWTLGALRLFPGAAGR